MELFTGQLIDIYFKDKAVKGNPMEVIKVKCQVLSKNWKRIIVKDCDGIGRSFKHIPFTAKNHSEKFIIL